MRQDLLILDRKDTHIEAASGRLTIRIANQRPISIALAPLDQIIVATPVKMGSQVLNHLSSHNIAVVFLASYYKHTACWLIPNNHGNHERRLQQYRLISNNDQQLMVAKKIVVHKVKGQQRNLLRWNKSFPAARKPLYNATQSIIKIRSQLTSAESHESLMGFEGAAAAAYFQAVAAMLADSYGFTGRNRRPPKDPINSILSLSYTLAQQEAESAIVAYGFDAGLGFLHLPAYGRKSLACDLLEPIRPIIDHWVIQLFTQQQLTIEHFYYHADACLLGKAGRQHYFMQWAKQRKILKRILHQIVRANLKALSHA